MSHFNRVFQANELLFSNPLNSVQARTTFDRSHTHKTSLDSGLLVPIYFDEVLPGDTHIIGMNYLARMTTPIVPIADNAVLDFSFFFVPTRIVWSEFKYFMGESRGHWAATNPPVPPQIYTQATDGGTTGRSVWLINGGYRPFDLAGYLGLPIKNKFLGTKESGSTISALPFYAYAQIWNDWFRDQNFQDPIYIPRGDVASNSGHDIISYGLAGNHLIDPMIDGSGIIAGFGLSSVSKLPDYFTTCLPSPQKGDPVSLPVGSLPAQRLEVRNRNVYEPQQVNTVLDNTTAYVGPYHNYQFLFGNALHESTAGNKLYVPAAFAGKQSNGAYDNNDRQTVYPTSGNKQWIKGFQVHGELLSNGPNAYTNAPQLYHDMVAELPAQSIGSVNLNDLRLAFSVQQFLETDARGGSRYIEILKNHFGVISPDARLQRAEYIGGFRDYLNVHQVLATTRSQNDGQHVGDLGAYSLTAGSMSDSIVYSSTEHGYIMGFVTVRVMHTYGQGVEKVWTRKSRYDYYFPVFDNLGEMPVYKREIAVAELSGTTAQNAADAEKWNRVFGYNEAWAEYRWAKNRVTGAFNPNKVSSSGKSTYLSAWSFTDNYNEQPTLNSGWIKENKSNVEQTLAVNSAKFGTNQFLFDFFFDVKSTRPMSMFSIPGLTRM